MAAWQFDLSFVPNDGPLPWLSDDGHQVPSLALEQSTHAHALLKRCFGEHWTMMEDFWVFGDENGHRVDLLLDDDGCAELSLRISAQIDSAQFIAAVCNIASELNCIFFSAEFWMALQPNEVELTSALNRSRASTYVRDPIRALRDLRHPH